MNGRKDKILKTLKIMCQESNENNENLSGITAQMIAAATGIDRSNVSRELNALMHDGKVVKIKGRPTFYLEKHMLMHKYSKEHIPDTFNSLDNLVTFINSNDDSISVNTIYSGIVQENSSPSSSFSHLIGEKESLKQQIKQAKAAILYPPNGLHMLILGETGIGKSTFVESIYQFLISTVKYNQWCLAFIISVD
jgi:transcriptional regulator with AAA-type ATPase domain